MGGRWFRQFFYNQVLSFEDQHAKQLPSSSYTPEEVEAGYEKLNNSFGFLLTLDNISTHTGIPEDELLGKWSVRRFYTKVKMLAWQAYCQKEYSRIVSK